MLINNKTGLIVSVRTNIVFFRQDLEFDFTYSSSFPYQPCNKKRLTNVL